MGVLTPFEQLSVSAKYHQVHRPYADPRTEQDRGGVDETELWEVMRHNAGTFK